MRPRTTPLVPTPFRVTVNVPTGFYKITNQGVTFKETVPGDWHFPLAKARAVFEAALRSVEVLMEVEESHLPSSPAANSGVGAEGGRTSGTRGRVSADDGEIPPAERPPSEFYRDGDRSDIELYGAGSE